MDTYYEIGARIKARRKELKLTQAELAARLGNKSRASVCTVESGKEDLTTTRIKQYAQALECHPAYLAGWDTEPIIAAYRAASPEIQAAVRAVLRMED